MHASVEQAHLFRSLFPGDADAIRRHLSGGEPVRIAPVAVGSTPLVTISLHQRRARTWKSDALVLGRAARAVGVPLYLERIRSGNGVRGWIFFDPPVPLDEAHRIAQDVLQAASEDMRSLDGVLPDGAADTLEPPLHPGGLAAGAGVFVEASRGLPAIADQWALLATLRRVGPSTSTIRNAAFETARLAIRRPLPADLAARLRRALVFVNPEHQRRAASGKSLRGVRRRILGFERRADGWLIPRGARGLLDAWWREQGNDLQIVDGRYEHPSRPLDVRTLDAVLEPVVEAVLASADGVLVGRDGMGRAQIALAAAARRGVPVLVCVPNRDRLEHWRRQAEIWLGIDGQRLATVPTVARMPDAFLTVAPYAAVRDLGPLLETRFAFLILDDCMRAPLGPLLEVLHAVPARWLLGIADQPTREDGMDELVRLHLGGPVHQMEGPQGFVLDVQMRNTHFQWSGDRQRPADDPSQPPLFALDEPAAEEGGGKRAREWITLLDAVWRDDARNAQVVRDVVAEARTGRSCVVLTARREHADTLFEQLHAQVGAVLAHGKTAPAARERAMGDFEQGRVPVLVVTEQLALGALETPRVERVFLALPATERQVRDYLGRLLRPMEGRETMRLYDYEDVNVPRLEQTARARRRLYRRERTSLNQDVVQLRLPFDDPS